MFDKLGVEEVNRLIYGTMCLKKLTVYLQNVLCIFLCISVCLEVNQQKSLLLQVQVKELLCGKNKAICS